jgi:hypothetical protein
MIKLILEHAILYNLSNIRGGYIIFALMMTFLF